MNSVTLLNPCERPRLNLRLWNLLLLSLAILLANSTQSHTARGQDSNTFYGIDSGQNTTGTDVSGFGYATIVTPPNTTYYLTYCTAAGFRAFTDPTGGDRGSNVTAIGSTVLENGFADDTAVGSPSSWSIYVSGIDSGVSTGYFSAGAFSCTSNGYLALRDTYDSQGDTGVGALALSAAGFDAKDNTANGVGALQFAQSAQGSLPGHNTAIGVEALGNDTSGVNNSSIGWNALFNNTTGGSNSAGGYLALSQNTTGNNNSALGNSALLANATGNTNIALGDAAGASLTTGSNNIEIANPGVAGESNTIRIGTRSQTVTNITGVRGTTVSGGIAVIIDANGRLGTTTSSAHFKEKIKPMTKNSEAIYSLQPVTFRYKKELDPASIPQFGLVAEEVAKVDPDLIVRDEQGRPYTVRYDAVNAMLLNEFLKQQREVEDQARVNEKQRATNQELKSTLARQNAELGALAVQISY